MENENKELDQNKSRKKKEPKTGWKAELISWIQVLVSAAVIAFVLTTFVIANSEVPTGSMENTIMAVHLGHCQPNTKMATSPRSGSANL